MKREVPSPGTMPRTCICRETEANRQPLFLGEHQSAFTLFMHTHLWANYHRPKVTVQFDHCYFWVTLLRAAT